MTTSVTWISVRYLGRQMPSTLGRLFDFAKAPTSSAIENFTTDALAGGIRADPRPFLLALRRRSLAESHDETRPDYIL